MVNYKVEAYNAVATFGILQCECRSISAVGAFGVGVAINPSECFASLLPVDACYGVINCQEQVSNAVAAVCIGIWQCNLIVTGFGVGCAIPFVAVANSNSVVAFGWSVDCEVKRYNRVTTINSLQCLYIVTRFGVGCAIPFKRRASCFRKFVCNCMIDCQVKCYNRVAAVCVGECLLEITRFSVVCAVPSVQIAGSCGKF